MLLWIDGFDSYGTTTGGAPAPAGVVGRSYPAIANEAAMVIRAGRLGGHALDLPVNNGVYFGVSSLTTVDTLVVGFAVNFSVLDSDYRFFGLYDGATLGINLCIQSTGEIAVKRDATVLATSSGANLTANNWYYIQLKVKCSSAAGTYELRVGGATVCSGTGVNTKAGTHDYYDGFRFCGTTGFHSVVVDDFYVLDTSGTANNDFLGNMRVVTVRPDGAGDSTQFTPDSGDNYSRVNESVTDDDASYVEDATVDHKDLYAYAALTGIVTGIAGVQVTTDCRETDATSFAVKMVCKSGATESDGTGVSVGSTNYVARRRILETDPNTSAAWTKTDLDAAQFGIKVG